MSKVRDLIKNSTFRAAKGFEELHPALSIVLPAYNRGDNGLFRRAVESLLGQDFKNFELIIVDDASVDSTVSIIEEFTQKDPRVAVIRHAVNLDLSAISVLEGYLKSRAPKLLCAFDDNEFTKEGIDALMRDQAEHHDHLISFGITRCHWQRNANVPPGQDDFDYERIKSENFIGHCSVLIDKKVIEEVGCYDPHISLMCLWDWDLWKRMAAKGYTFHRVPFEITNEYGSRQPDNLSHTAGLDTAVTLEWMNFDRNESLRPENILDYDFDAFYPENSFYFKAKLSQIIQNRFGDRHKLNFAVNFPFALPLIVGSNSGLGYDFRRVMKNRLAYFDTDITSFDTDITSVESIRNYAKGKKISAIINCAALSIAGPTEEQSELCQPVNIDEALNMSVIANELDVPLIYYSTCDIFDGTANIPYQEDDAANPLSENARRKFEIEQKLLKETNTAVIIRVAWLISSAPNSFIEKIVTKAERDGEAPVVSDQVGSPVYTGDLIKHTMEILEKIKPGTREIYHIANEGVCSWYDLAHAVIQELKIPGKALPVLSSDYGMKAERLQYSVLDKTKAKRDFGLEIRHWRDTIKSAAEDSKRPMLPRFNDDYIVILPGVLDACTFLYFGTFDKIFQERVIIITDKMIAEDELVCANLIANANAVIYVRYIQCLLPYLTLIRRNNVPYYYYTDDDLFGLGYEPFVELTADVLKHAAGIITTNVHLEEWFKQKNLNDKFFSVRPSYSKELRRYIKNVPGKYDNPSKLNLLFASNYRIDGLLNWFPVFKNLSARGYKLKFYFYVFIDAKNTENRNKFLELCGENGIEVELLDAVSSYETFIEQIRRFDIHFYFVPYSERTEFQINYKNKTFNPLLAAYLASSVPFFPDIETYSVLKEVDGVRRCVVSSNGEMERAILKILTDKEFASEVLDGIRKFSAEYFAPEHNQKIIEEIFALHGKQNQNRDIDALKIRDIKLPLRIKSIWGKKIFKEYYADAKCVLRIFGLKIPYRRRGIRVKFRPVYKELKENGERVVHLFGIEIRCPR